MNHQIYVDNPTYLHGFFVEEAESAVDDYLGDLEGLREADEDVERKLERGTAGFHGKHDDHFQDEGQVNDELDKHRTDDEDVHRVVGGVKHAPIFHITSVGSND